MIRKISLTKYEQLEGLMLMLRKIGLVDNMTIVWEKRPQLTINQLGNFEFTNPEEVYGVVISFWADDFKEISKTRFCILEDEDG